MKTTPVTRAIAYLRVSTDQQADSGLGLEAQEAAVRSAASRLRLELVRTFVDAGTSGKLGIEDRPVLLEAVAALRRGDVLLLANRDRIGRDVIAVAMIERLVTKRGARVISAAGEGTESDDPAGVLMRRLIDSVAEYERLIISARTRPPWPPSVDGGEICYAASPSRDTTARSYPIDSAHRSRLPVDVVAVPGPTIPAGAACTFARIDSRSWWSIPVHQRMFLGWRNLSGRH